MSMQSLGFAAQSVAGRVRGHNEDAVLCLPELGLWAVADGMGGHECGEVASALALDTLRQSIVAGSGLESSIHAAHQAILAAVQEEGGRRMGSTVVAVRFVDADYEVAWIGDSRAYRISLDGIERLTRDHSWVQAMIDAGELSLDEARQHPRRNIVTQCLGQGEQALEVLALDFKLRREAISHRDLGHRGRPRRLAGGPRDDGRLDASHRDRPLRDGAHRRRCGHRRWRVDRGQGGAASLSRPDRAGGGRRAMIRPVVLCALIALPAAAADAPVAEAVALRPVVSIIVNPETHRPSLRITNLLQVLGLFFHFMPLRLFLLDRILRFSGLDCLAGLGFFHVSPTRKGRGRMSLSGLAAAHIT